MFLTTRNQRIRLYGIKVATLAGMLAIAVGGCGSRSIGKSGSRGTPVGATISGSSIPAGSPGITPTPSSDKQNSSNPPAGGSSFYATDSSKLPACDSLHVGQLYYLTTEKQFKSCDGSTWKDIMISTSEDSSNNSRDEFQEILGTNSVGSVTRFV